MADFEGFTPLNMLNANRDDWKIRVKVYLLWNQSYRDNPSQVASMEMILIDQEGHKIQASVMKFLIPDFRDTIKEGSYYEISNFGLGPNKGNYLLVEHEWKINFLRITKVRIWPSFEIATDGFNLVSFDDVLQWRVSRIFAFDVVGHLVEIKEIRINRESGKESKSIEFVLEDLDGNRINCALWGDNATKLVDYVTHNQNLGENIIAYVQQLENSHMELNKLKEKASAATQKASTTNQGEQGQPYQNKASFAFQLTYSRWFEEQMKHIQELRIAIYSNRTDVELQPIVEKTKTHFSDIFEKKKYVAKDDVFQIVYGMWTSPAERCIMWIGGFRSSDILKIIENHVDLTERQKKTLSDLCVSTIHEEDCISQGMDKMQQSLAESLVKDANIVSIATSNLTTYMSQMAMAMGKLGVVETFLYQAEKLREDTLKRLHELLTTRQSALALLAINDYFSRLQALSTLWTARPRD